jgi:hypothetical protein
MRAESTTPEPSGFFVATLLRMTRFLQNGWLKSQGPASAGPWVCIRRNGLVAEEQNAFNALFAFFEHRPVEELVVVQVDLQKRGPVGNVACDQRF